MRSVLITLLILLAFPACSRFPSAQNNGNSKADELILATAERRDFDYNIEVTGDVAPDFLLEIKPEVGGKVRKIHVLPGQFVEAGTILVEIDDRDLQTEKASVLTEIEGAKVTVEKLERNYARAKDLFAANLISREVYDNLASDAELAQNSLQRARRRLDIVEEKLERTIIVAPLSGTVLEVKVVEGQVTIPAASVNSGTTLLTLADLSKLLVQSHVNQFDVGKLSVGLDVAIRSESLRGAEMRATVSFIAPVATAKNNVKGFGVEARIIEPDPRLRPGMTVNLSIPVASAKDAISVPISAVFRGNSEDERVVYVHRSGTHERRIVEVGVTNLDFAEIKTGLQPGDQVLLVEPKAADAAKS